MWIFLSWASCPIICLAKMPYWSFFMLFQTFNIRPDLECHYPPKQILWVNMPFSNLPTWDLKRNSHLGFSKKKTVAGKSSTHKSGKYFPKFSSQEPNQKNSLQFMNILNEITNLLPVRKRIIVWWKTHRERRGPLLCSWKRHHWMPKIWVWNVLLEIISTVHNFINHYDIYRNLD